MTPDRTDHTPDEPEHGVLSDTGSLETTGIGIIGGATAQVNVELPTEEDDDLADDGVIDDEVPFVIELPAEDMPFVVEIPAAADTEPVVETAVAEIVESEPELEEWTVEEGGFTAVDRADDIHDADEVLTEVEADVAVAVIAEELGDDFDVEEFDVSEYDVSEYSAAEFAVEAVGSEETANEVLAAEAPAAEGADAEASGEVGADATDDDTTDAVEEPVNAHNPSDDETHAAVSVPDASVSDAPEAPIAPASPPPAPVTAAATAAAATAPAATTPATRREAHHTGALPVVDRVDRVERVQPRPEVALTSKRLGEFEADRETADLLTADRLLDPHQVVRSEPEGAWQHFVYSVSGHRINLGDSKRARARKALDRRIAAPLDGGARFVPVLSRKGGVGKTTVTTLLGMALADARDDRVIAVDANPDRGTLAERISRESGKTVRDLVRIRGDVVGFNDLSNIVARDETRLDVVASDTDPRVSEAFNDSDYRDVASLAAHYYSVVLTDTGTGIVHSVMGATLNLSDQLVIVAGLSVDEARLASETLTWLETNGYSDKVRSAVVVLNNARPGQPLVQLDELDAHFRSRVRAVVRMPYDPHIAAGSAIVFRDLQPATRLAARELAATVIEGLRSYAPAA
ncbi:MinD/ParA family ATP-binding protein [Microbacterium allomyrinae]|uniref:MinD/ParA family ATP-binding protein n=1 Tax=Microbacterium allomyrinae TaxID=2830666 RepID=UPI001E35B6F0|nr:MinD/ParA family protein [Microbacterium allomyrinae]